MHVILKDNMLQLLIKKLHTHYVISLFKVVAYYQRVIQRGCIILRDVLYSRLLSSETQGYIIH